MAFIRLEKGTHISPHDPMTVSVTKSGFSLGSGICSFFGQHTCAEIHLDYEGNRIGFKPTNDMSKGFKLSRQGKSWGLSATQFAKRIPVKKYTGRFEGDMVVFDVEEIATKK